MANHITPNRHDGVRSLNADPYPSTPRLWLIGPAARYVGLTTKALVSGIENGDIPIFIYSIGPGGRRYVNIEQLLRHFNLRLPATEAENLF